MDALTQRRMDGKTLWKVYGERRESFGKIDAITVLFKVGSLSRNDAAQYLLEHVSEEDLVEYRKAFGIDPLEL